MRILPQFQEPLIDSSGAPPAQDGFAAMLAAVLTATQTCSVPPSPVAGSFTLVGPVAAQGAPTIVRQEPVPAVPPEVPQEVPHEMLRLSPEAALGPELGRSVGDLEDIAGEQVRAVVPRPAPVPSGPAPVPSAPGPAVVVASAPATPEATAALLGDVADTAAPVSVARAVGEEPGTAPAPVEQADIASVTSSAGGDGDEVRSGLVPIHLLAAPAEADADAGAGDAGGASLPAVPRQQTATAAAAEHSAIGPLPITTAPAAATSSPQPAPLSQPSAVVQQVYPVVARLATEGEGVHRLTLRVHPEELGPVQIAVTVRDGLVQVSLTALDEAQIALQSGVEELRRMLHDAGLAGADVDVSGGLDGQPQHEPHPTDGLLVQLTANDALDDPDLPGPARPQRVLTPDAIDLRL